MDTSSPNKPLIPARSVVLAEHFCEATGMDPALLRSLVNDGQLDGLVTADGDVVGVFDDALPSAERLRTMGAQPHADYDPDRLRSYEDDEDDEDDADDADDADDRSSWEMSWPE